jgi:phospholipid/cholesterol/gamma-HCH transport system substrate-binding protein
MQTQSNYTLTGLFVVSLGALAVFLGLWIAGEVRHGESEHYIVYVEEPVTGLYENARVLFQGVPVGRVRQMELDRDNPQRVRLVIALEEGAPVRSDTTATLSTQGATGLMRLELSGGSPDAGPPGRAEGEPYPVIPSEPSFWAQLNDNVTGGLDDVEVLAGQLRSLLHEDNVAAASNILTNLSEITDRVANNRETIDRLMAGAGQLGDAAGALSQRLPETMDRLDEALVSIDRFSASVVEAADDVSSMAGAGEGGLRRFGEDTLPRINELVSELDRLATRLQRLSERLENQPDMLIQGEPAVEPGPGER